MERVQVNQPQAAEPRGVKSAPGADRSARSSGYHASAERVCRWVADDQDEVDGVVVRTWN